MAAELMEIEVEKRETFGKKARKDAVSKGMIPGVVYGEGKEPVPITVDSRRIIQILRSEKGMNSLLLFSLKGTKSKRHVMIKDFQIDPVSNTLIHADFKRIDVDKKVRVRVPIVCEGVAFGVKNQGAIVDIILREVEVECLPMEVPDKLRVDLTPLKMGDSIKVSELKVPETIHILAEDKSQPVVVVAAPRVEAEPVPAAEEAASIEPEVIGKGKKPEEGEEGAGEEAPADKKDKSKEKGEKKK